MEKGCQVCTAQVNESQNRKGGKQKKRIVSVLLALVCLLLLTPYSYAETKTGIDVRIEQVCAQLETDFENGIFTVDGNVCKHIGYKNQFDGSCDKCSLKKIYYKKKGTSYPGQGAWTCAAFARYVFYEIFGVCYRSDTLKTAGPADKSSSYATLNKGDYIFSGIGEKGHYMIFLSADSKGISVMDANGEALRAIRYNRRLLYSNSLLKGKTLEYYHAPNYDEISRKYSPCTSHKYNSSGYCANCGADFMTAGAKPDKFCTPVIISPKAVVRERPYYEGKVLTTIPSGTNLVTEGRLQNHIAGHYWYAVTYNGITGYVWMDNVVIPNAGNSYKIRYDANGGTGAPDPQNALVGKETILSDVSPTRSGYAFSGWSTHKNQGWLSLFSVNSIYLSGYTYSFSARKEDTVTLYAVWEETPGGNTTAAPAKQTAIPEAAIPVRTTPTPQTISTPAPVTSDPTSSEAGNVTTQMDTFRVTIPAGKKLWLYRLCTDTDPFTYIKAKDASYRVTCTARALFDNGDVWYFFRTGDDKDVWFLFESGMSLEQPTPTPGSITVSFDANGGSGAPGAITGFLGIPLTIPSQVPTRAGYRFNGWSKQSNAAELPAYYTYTAGDSFLFDSSCILYAVWLMNPQYTEPTPMPQQPAEPQQSDSTTVPYSDPATPEPIVEEPPTTETPITPIPEPVTAPPAVTEEPTANTNTTVTLDVPYMVANDSRWSDMKLGNSRYTVGDSGGFLTCMAMYESYRLGADETPKTLIDGGRAKFSSTGGLLFSCDLYDPYVGANYSLKTIYDLLLQDKPVIVWVSNGGKQYAEIVYGFSGDTENMKASDFMIYDPMNSTTDLGQWSSYGRICYYP